METKPRNYALVEGRILSESELKLMLKSIRPSMELAVRTKKNLHFVNDFYLISFGALTGLRVSEVANVRISDITENAIRVIGKGSKLRSVPLGRRGHALITELLRVKREVMNQSVEPNQLLFMNRSNKPFTRFAIGRRFDFWKQRCGINRELGFHSLRHHFCTYLLNNGFLLHEAQQILGHSNISTTAGYLHFTRGTLDRVDAVL